MVLRSDYSCVFMEVSLHPKNDSAAHVSAAFLPREAPPFAFSQFSTSVSSQHGLVSSHLSDFHAVLLNQSQSTTMCVSISFLVMPWVTASLSYTQYPLASLP